MAAVDFSSWAVPDLVLTLGGVTYTVAPPSVERAKLILACTAKAEVDLGLHPGPVPEDIVEALNQLGDTPLGDVSLGPVVRQQLVDAGHPPLTIDRMAYYAMLFWARGKKRADAIATLLWTQMPDSLGDEAEGTDAPGEAARR